MREIKAINCIVKPDAGLCNPSSLYFDNRKEELYICDMGNARVVRYFYCSGKLQDIGQDKESGNLLIKPLALTMDGENHLFVTDVQRNCLLQYFNGSFFDIPIRQKLNLPGSVTVGDKGAVYISDFHHNRIIKRCPANNTFVLEEIPCLQMYGIFYKHFWLYITDTGHNRIVRYHTVKKYLEVIPWSGITPIAIAVGDDNRIYFSENRRIFCLFSDGRKVLMLDKKLWKEYNFEGLGHIGAIAIKDEKSLFFSDTIKNCIYEILL